MALHTRVEGSETGRSVVAVLHGVPSCLPFDCYNEGTLKVCFT